MVKKILRGFGVMKKISLLHTEWSDGWGGQEIRILSESKELIKRGNSVIIAAQPNSQLLKKSREVGIPVLSLKMSKGLNIFATYKLVRFIKENQIDIVHTHSSVDSRVGGLAGRIARIPVVRSRHISIPVSQSMFTWFQYMKLASKVITSGLFIKDTLVQENNMIPDHIVSIPAGADEEKYCADASLEDVRHKFGLDKNEFVIGMVSVLRSWKGHNYVIESMKHLVEQTPNIRLLIVGDGPKKDEIQTLIGKYQLEKHVTLAGHQSDPTPFYQAMDMVILPSYAGEATSQTLPQAMLMEKPVVSTDIGGLPEVVIHNKTGLVVPPQDSESIASSILALYFNVDLRNKLAKQGREHALKYFTFGKMVDSTYNVYVDLLKER